MAKEELDRQYPYRATIIKDNPYHLPVGKKFPWAKRKEGDASPFMVLVRSTWPSTFGGRDYQLHEDEVLLEKRDA